MPNRVNSSKILRREISVPTESHLKSIKFADCRISSLCKFTISLTATIIFHWAQVMCLSRATQNNNIKALFFASVPWLGVAERESKIGIRARCVFTLLLAMKGESHFASLPAAPHPLPPRLFLLFDVTSTRLCLFCQWRRRAREKIQLVFRVRETFKKMFYI